MEKMKKDRKNYSVLMSVYKNEKSGILRESMQSIYDQTIPTDDFLLICDGPLTNRLNEVIDEMQKKFGQRLRVIRHTENHGLGYCLRIGIPECKNDLIARMDSDDISRKDRCEKQLEIFEKYPDVSAVGCIVGDFKVTPQGITTMRKVPETNEAIRKFAKWRSPMNHPSVMLRKKDILAVGNYPDVRNCQDWYLWINLLTNGYKCYNIQEILVYMREDHTTFKRRAGYRYFKIQKHLYDIMRERKFISLPMYMTAVSVRFCSAMAPNGIRKALFKRFMREKVKNEHED
ncbi:glycosyltransferase [Candidatus Saccharibacteria bacterium]|nr:glycosyltransferase [Candidatus Saccharibacteria bacterium]